MGPVYPGIQILMKLLLNTFAIPIRFVYSSGRLIVNQNKQQLVLNENTPYLLLTQDRIIDLEQK